MKNPLQSKFRLGKVYAGGLFLHMICIPILYASPSIRISLNTPPTPLTSSFELKVEEQVITGTVTDQNGEPLPGVTISVEGTTIGTATDIDGKYTLDIPDGATLVFSFIGFQTQRIAAGTRSVVDVT